MLVSSRLEMYRVTESLGFIRDVLQLYKDNPMPALFEFTNALSRSYEELSVAFKKEQSSVLTMNIAEADDRRDYLYVGLRKLTEGFMLSPNVTEQKAAEVLARSIKQYGKDAHRLNYQAQTTVFDSLIMDWQNKPDSIKAVSLLNLGHWITALKEYNEQVKKLLLNRVQEKASDTAEPTLDLRRKMIQDYRNLVKYFEAMQLLNPSPKATILIQQQNVLTEQYNLILKKRQSNKEETASKE